MGKGIFITATGTDAGKTIVTAGLGVSLISKKIKTAVFKPIATGGVISSDAVVLQKYVSAGLELSEISPVILDKPLAPYSILRRDGGSIDISKILNLIRESEKSNDILLVEGIGGVLVPILKHYSVIDFIVDLGYPAIVVADAGLGTINHTLMTLNLLKLRRIPVLGFILNDATNKTGDISKNDNNEIISELSGVECLGILPFIDAENEVVERLGVQFEPIIERVIAKI